MATPLVRKRKVEGKDTQLIINNIKISAKRVQKHMRRTKDSEGDKAITSSENSVTIITSTPSASNYATKGFPPVSYIFDYSFAKKLPFAQS